MTHDAVTAEISPHTILDASSEVRLPETSFLVWSAACHGSAISSASTYPAFSTAHLSRLRNRSMVYDRARQLEALLVQHGKS